MMNKKLLALAVAAAVMPAAALASGPTLYGKINVSLESEEIDVPAPAVSSDQFNVVNNASRIGVRGDAETGLDGVKGLYKAEFGVDADDGAAPFTDRDIYVGLTGGFGTVLLGNMDTPTKVAQGKVDQFNDTSVDMASHVAGELRAPNIVAYASPKIADAVTVTVALWQGEGADGPAAGVDTDLNGVGDAVSASVAYENEGLYLALAMDMETPVSSGLIEAARDTATPALTVYNDITRLVAAYSTDTFEVGALYQMVEGVNDDVLVGPVDWNEYEDTSMVLSGAYKTGDWKFKAQYGMSEIDISGSTLEATMMGLGADYAIGKSTTASAFFANEDVETNVPGGGDAERTVISVGLEQKF